MKSFKIALAQFSPHIGNIEANAQKMLDQINEAKKQKADLIVFPELSTVGYPAEDLLLRPSLAKRTQKAFELLSQVKDIVVVFGFVNQTEDGQRYKRRSGHERWSSVGYLQQAKPTKLRRI